MKRLTGIFFVLLLLQWTVFFITVNADSDPYAENELERVSEVLFRILIFPIYDIFFQEVSNTASLLIGFGLNALLQALALYILSKIAERQIFNH